MGISKTNYPTTSQSVEEGLPLSWTLATNLSQIEDLWVNHRIPHCKHGWSRRESQVRGEAAVR